jgi:hypothetical protein
MSLLKDKIELEVELAEYQAQQSLQKFPPILRWLLIGCILAAVPGYYIAKSISYNYWTGHYKQYAISAKASFTDPKEPKASNVTLTSTGNGVYAATMQLTNQNADLALPRADYEFTFYNAAQQQVYRETGTTFLVPNGQKYLVVPRFTSKDAVTAANFRFTSPLHWEKRISIPKVNIIPSPVDTYNQLVPQAFVAEGSYLNSSPYQLGALRLTFLVFDRDGKLIGASRRDDFTVAPGERRTYKQIWPNVYGDPSYTVKVFVETNVFDAKNLTLPTAPNNSASDLSRPANNQ